jgi:hypothetical protein
VGDRWHDEVRELLVAYSLGALDASEAMAVEAHVAECESCRDDLGGYETAAAELTGAMDRMWGSIASTLAGRRDDLDCFLAQLTATAGDRPESSGPVRVLVASDTEAARLVLSHRIAGDDRFSVIGQAEDPAEMLAEGVSGLPDVVVVKLAHTDRRWLDALGELSAWSPRTRLLAVSGVHADHLAELMLTPAVADGLAAGRPPGAVVAAGRGDRRPTVAPIDVRTEPAVAPRSIVHEVMRQMGIPVRVQR